jgi:taurine--2-oxoglutarate transaminase
MLMIADEVMVGFGRTGRWFACDHWDVVPDIMTLAKGLTNGAVPLAATVVREPHASLFDEQAWMHGHTYSGHALACAAASRTIEVYREDKLIERSGEFGDYLIDKAYELQQRHVCVGDVRGKGLFVGIELGLNRDKKEPLVDYPCKLPVKSNVQAQVLQQAMRDGLYLMNAHPNVLVLCPPLIIEKDEITWAMEVLDSALTQADRAVH